MKFKPSIFAIAFASVGALWINQANAGSIVTLAPGVSNHSGYVSDGPFTSDFAFSPSSNASLLVSATGSTLPWYITNNLSMSLFQANSSGAPIGTALVSSAVGKTLSFSGLQSGADYALVVNGTATGSYGGIFNFTTTTTALAAVPIPGAVVLFGSGLLGLAAVGRRKAKANAV